MRKIVFALACVMLAPMFLVGVTSSAPYDPWCDIDDDGDIDIFDVVQLASRYGSTGVPINKTTLLLDLLDQVYALNASIHELQERVFYLEGLLGLHEQLDFTDFAWGSGNGYCLLQVENTGLLDLTISEVRVNDVIAADDGITTPYTVTPGSAVTLNVTCIGGYTSGVAYGFTVITMNGSIFGPYVRIAL